MSVHIKKFWPIFVALLVIALMPVTSWGYAQERSIPQPKPTNIPSETKADGAISLDVLESDSKGVEVTSNDLDAPAASSAMQADAENVEFVGHFGGPTLAVAVQGDYAYVGEGQGLRLTILDISNPADPSVVGKTVPIPDNWPDNWIKDIAVDGDYAYVADYKGGLRVVDVSDPANPTEVGACDTLEYASGVFVSGSTAYVADGRRGLRVVDVSEPASPTEVGACDTGWAEGVAVSGGTAYVADMDGGLRVVDVSDPANPTEVGACDTPGEAMGVAVSGETAYVADDWRGLRVVDVSDPANPTEVGSYDTPGRTRGVAVSGGTAYVADMDGGLRAVDVSDPATPTEVGSYDTPGRTRGVFVSGETAYVADYQGGLRVVDVSDPANPTEVGAYDTPGRAEGVFVSGSTAYVANEQEGLRVVDVHNPANPTEVGACDTPGDALDVFVSGAYAYVADMDGGLASGLRVVDVSNPASPTEVGAYNTWGLASGVFVSGDYAYVANSVDGLLILRYTGGETTHAISGHVRDSNGNPIPGVTVSAGSGGSATTDTSGAYDISDLVTDTYTLTPSKEGYDFSPQTRTVSVPPDATGQDFTGKRWATSDGDPPLFFMSGNVIGEEDRRISLGDHAQLRVTVKNTSNETMEDAQAFVRDGDLNNTSSPLARGFSIHNGTSWSPRHEWLPVSITPPVLQPGEVGQMNFWIYVFNHDPDILENYPSGAWIDIKLTDEVWEVKIPIKPIEFDISEHQDMKEGSCLHNPDNPQIKRYAQYAAGASGPSTPPSNDEDPDTPEQAVRNLTHQVHEEFSYVEWMKYTKRKPDTVLLNRRRGVCHHYADFTIGLLRSLGFPTRYISARFDTGSHAWVETYFDKVWNHVDITWGVALDKGLYKHVGKSIKAAWADKHPLGSDSILSAKVFRCEPFCYQFVQCFMCTSKTKTNIIARCVEDVRDDYNDVNVGHSMISLSTSDNRQFSIQLEAPTLVTRTVLFTLTTRVVNSTTTSLSPLTASVQSKVEYSSTQSAFATTPLTQNITALDPGQSVTLTWTVTPLLSGSGIPLYVNVFNDALFETNAQLLGVNEPGTLPDLDVGSVCSLNTVSPGEAITLTAYTNSASQAITDTDTTITATVYATPTLGFSTTVDVPYCETCGMYRRVLSLPDDAPTGRYDVHLRATNPDYDPDESESTFFVTSPLTLALETQASSLTVSDTLTITAQVYDRGVPITSASVRAGITTPSGVITVPLFLNDSGAYVTSFRPADLAPNLHDQVSVGDWTIHGIADYRGSKASAQQTVAVQEPLGPIIYLPLVLRNP